VVPQPFLLWAMTRIKRTEFIFMSPINKMLWARGKFFLEIIWQSHAIIFYKQALLSQEHANLAQLNCGELVDGLLNFVKENVKGFM